MPYTLQWCHKCLRKISCPSNFLSIDIIGSFNWVLYTCQNRTAEDESWCQSWCCAASNRILYFCDFSNITTCMSTVSLYQNLLGFSLHFSDMQNIFTVHTCFQWEPQMILSSYFPFMIMLYGIIWYQLQVTDIAVFIVLLLTLKWLGHFFSICDLIFSCCSPYQQ